MSKRAPSQLFLLFVVLTFCASTVACGGAPQGVARTQNPLVAQYTIAPSCAGQFMVEFGPDTSYGKATAWWPTPGGYRPTSIFVAGMKASTTYHMHSQTQCSGGGTETSDDLTFTTGPLPSIQFPTLAVTRPNPSASSPE